MCVVLLGDSRYMCETCHILLVKTVLHLQPALFQRGRGAVGDSGLPVAQAAQMTWYITVKSEVLSSQGTVTHSTLGTHFLSSFLCFFFPPSGCNTLKME